MNREQRHRQLAATIASLRTRRCALGITQEQAAHLLDVTPRSFSDWERNVKSPTAEHLYSWASILELDIVVKDNSTS
jgi:transcriptional regulator with XRE-family HTH domain